MHTILSLYQKRDQSPNFSYGDVGREGSGHYIQVTESILAEDLANDRVRSQLLLEEAMTDIRQDADWFTVVAMQRAWSLIMESEINAALMLAKEVIFLAEQHHRFNTLIEAYKIIGLALQYDGRFGDAMQVLETATVKAKDWG